MFPSPKVWDMFNVNLGIQVFEKLQRSKQNAVRYTASKSRNEEGMF